MIELVITTNGVSQIPDEMRRIARMVEEGYVEGEVIGGYWKLNEDNE